MFQKYFYRHNNAIQLIFKHLLVSVICASVDFILFAICIYYLMLSITWSYVIAFSTATTIGFFGHSYFTFSVGKAHLRNLILFIFQASLSFLIGFFSLKVLIALQVPVMLAKLIQLGMTFFFNVTVGKFITFKKRRGIL